MARAQGKHREFGINWSVTTLYLTPLPPEVYLHRPRFFHCDDKFLFNGVFTLSETENDFSSETDKMLKSSQSH